MGFRARVAALVALASFVVTSLAAAADIVDRVQVGVPGRSATTGFSAALALVLSAPPKHERACCYDSSSGAWAGPRYRAERDPQRGGNSLIGWNVRFHRSSASPAALARQALFLQAPVVARGRVAISHLVGRRKAGSIKGAYVVVGEAAPAARHQVAIAVPLSKKVKAVTLFDLSAPFSDSAGIYGQYVIEGVRPSAWNRSQALLLVRRLALEGSLQPSKITARTGRGRVAGSVVDVYGHPVAEAPIKLQARRGGGWRVVKTGATTTRGRFAFSGVGQGAYRLLATLSGSKATRGVRIP